LSSLYSRVNGPSQSTWCSVQWSRSVQACALWYIQWPCSSPWHFGSRVCVISHICYWSFATSVMKSNCSLGHSAFLAPLSNLHTNPPWFFNLFVPGS
jgi:hypothetical protein